jgi:hypothetical protein
LSIENREILSWSVSIVTIQLPAAYVTASAAKQSPARCGGLLRQKTPRNDIRNAQDDTDQHNINRICQQVLPLP